MAKARSGPSRSGRSAPFKKSQRSLTRLAVHCIVTAKTRHSRATTGRKPPSVKARADPMRIRMTEFPRLYGRMARIHAESEFVFKFRSGLVGFSA